MKNERDKERILQYLLGELTEAEQTAYEQELLADREAFEQVWQVENRLIDTYVRREMSRRERKRFERFYLTSPIHRERVAIAEMLLEEIDVPLDASVTAKPTETESSWWRGLGNLLSGWNLALASATAIILLFAGITGWLWSERSQLREQIAGLEKREAATSNRGNSDGSQAQEQKQALENELARKRAQNDQLAAELERLRKKSEAAPATIFSFLLIPSSVRGGDSSPPPQVPFLKSPVRLIIKLDRIKYAKYDALIKTVDGKEIFHLTADPANNDFVTVTIPPGKLAKNDYILVLSGRQAAGAIEEIDQYLFRVQ